MANIVQEKTIRCRYANADEFVKSFRKFGWELKSKTLFNSLGNPLPIDAKITEEDLYKKCLCDLLFKRTINEDILVEMDALETKFVEFSSVKPKTARTFIKYFIACLLLLALTIVSASFTEYGFKINTILGIVLLVLAAVFGVLFLLVVVLAIVEISASKKRKEEIAREKLKLEETADYIYKKSIASQKE